MKPNSSINPAAVGSRSHDAGVQVLTILKALDYRFVTPTPATHGKVLQHPGRTRAADIRDIFGWSLPFSAGVLPLDLFNALRASDGLLEDEAGYWSRYRVASLGEDLFLHAAFPPSSDDAVFFGPDTYRFARFLRQVIGSTTVERVIDIGAGSGAGAVVAARAGRAKSLILTDVNSVALATAQMNLEAGGLTGDYRLGSGLATVPEEADLIIANPPFIAGDSGRTYRDGGDMKGARLSLNWALAAAKQLAPEGRFILYTGSAIVNGVDGLREALTSRLNGELFELKYEELDPDIFGDQLSAPGYENVERIAAIGAVISRR